MTTIRFKLPKISQVEFTIECLPEEIPVKGNCSAIDEETDRETEEHINNQLNSGNEWAWCCVKVTAKYKGIEGADYLGGCSYESEKDFTEQDGYYKDMKQAAFNDLINNLNDLRD
jgi:hypothetical protein